MLSKLDIENEIGENINIYPLIYENFKENSINLGASSYAWTMGEQIVYYDHGNFELLPANEKAIKYEFHKGDKSVVSLNGLNYILLLPHTTTLIVTNEAIATGHNIGGTYHSKVGLVSLGLGHIGTMIGPNFSGKSLVAIHNLSENIITLKEGETFVSVVFHYLTTPIVTKNPTTSSHVDKFAEFGITLTKEDYAEIASDWQQTIDGIKSKMESSKEYAQFVQKRKDDKKLHFRKLFSKRNILLAIGLLTFISILLICCYWLDIKFDTHDWSNRGWSVVFSGIFITIVASIVKKIK